MTSDTRTGSLRLAAGGRLTVVEPKLGGGGEGTVYALAEPAGQVVKVYTPKVLASHGDILSAKLTAMIAKPPEDPTASQGHCSLPWPRSLVVDGAGAFAGYVMPAIDSKSSAELHMVSNPSDRTRSPKAPRWLAGFGWNRLLRVAMNLAAATQALHDVGYVIGDFNERNVLVSNNTLVSLVDLDSIQVPRRDGPAFLCTVVRPEYTAPELIGADLHHEARTVASDCFPLAVHIYQLLMEGKHPFAGIWRGKGDKPAQHELAGQGLFAQSGDRRLSPQAGTPPFGILTPDVQELFRRAFVTGATDPSARPDGVEWHEHLERLYASLVTCKRESGHMYGGHLKACPWCDLARQSQVVTGPRSRPAQAPLPPVSAPARPQPPPPWAGPAVPVRTAATAGTAAPGGWRPPAAGGWRPPAATAGLAGRWGARTLPPAYRFSWLISGPALAFVAVAAFVAPLESFYAQLWGYLGTLVVSRLVGAGYWIRNNGLRGFRRESRAMVLRDLLGTAGLVLLAFLALWFAVSVLMPAVGPGNPHAYRIALNTNGPRNPFSNTQQLGYFLHLFWVLPAVALAAVALFRRTANLDRPLVMPRAARFLNSQPARVRQVVGGVLLAATAVLIGLNGGLSPAAVPSGAVCTVAPLTCHSAATEMRAGRSP